MLKTSSIAFFSLFLIACGGGSGGGSDDGTGTGGVNNPVSSEYTQTTSDSLTDFQLPAVKTGIDGQDFEGVWLVKTTSTTVKKEKSNTVDNVINTTGHAVGLMTIINKNSTEYTVIGCTNALLDNEIFTFSDTVEGTKLNLSSKDESDGLDEHSIVFTLTDGEILGSLNSTRNHDVDAGEINSTVRTATINAIKVSDLTEINKVSEVDIGVKFSGIDMSAEARCLGFNTFVADVTPTETGTVAYSVTGQSFKSIFEQDTQTLGKELQRVIVSSELYSGISYRTDIYQTGLYTLEPNLKLTNEVFRDDGLGNENSTRLRTTVIDFGGNGISNNSVNTDSSLNVYLNKADNDHVQMSGIISGDISRRATVGFKLNN